MVNGYFQVCYPMCSLTNPQGCGPENQRKERSLNNVPYKVIFLNGDKRK